MAAKKLVSKFLMWRIRHLSDRNFVLIVSGVVGCVSGLAAVILKWGVHKLHHLLTGNFDTSYYHYFYFFFPLIGIFLSYMLAKYVFREKLSHGVTSVLYSISKGSSILKKRLMASRVFTSAVTVGFGGSVGLEAPIVVTGSAIGSNIARTMHLNYPRRSLMIGCGSAAAVSAIFNSPIAGVIFSVEVILSEVNINKFIPLLIASVCGSIVSLLLLGDEILFTFTPTFNLEFTHVPHFIFLGIMCGLVSVYFTRMHYFLESTIAKFNDGIPKVIFGGLMLGVMIFVFPPLYGEGYSTLKLLLANNESTLLHNSLFFGQDQLWFIITFLVSMILIKAVASALTIGSGGSGGIFAPSLFIGGMTGFLYSRVASVFGFAEDVHHSNFTLVGMCGVMSGVLHAPLTAIFLIAEITQGYTLFVPLMIVSAISYSTIYYFEPHSMYTKHLIEKGDLIKNDRDREVLSLIDIQKVIERDFKTVHPDALLGELIEIVKNSSRNIYPVVNSECRLVGIIHLDDIRKMMFDLDKHSQVIVKTIMHIPKDSISTSDDMNKVMSKFEHSGQWNLPVINDDVYVGFISKSKIFNAYRKRLIRQNRE